MATLNTKTMIELEKSFNEVVEKWTHDFGAITVEYGLKTGEVKLEDGLPWLAVHGQFTSKTAKQFMQALADALNIRMLFNRLEKYPGEPATLHGVFDLHPDKMEETDSAIAAYSDDPEAKEFMEDYGKEILPCHYKKHTPKN